MLDELELGLELIIELIIDWLDCIELIMLLHNRLGQ